VANTFKNFSGSLSTTAQTTAYTAPANTQSVIQNLTISNVDGTNDCDVTIEVTDTSAATTNKLAYLITVPARNSLIWDKPINLEATDVLKITAAVANDLHFYGSVLEIT
jgi:hypothetical protein